MSRKGKRRKYATNVPHLVRQRGRKRFWTGWLDGKEVSLGTADAVAAQRCLDTLAEERRRASANAPPTPTTSLAELAAKFFEHISPPRQSPRTFETYSSRTTAFVEWAEKEGVTCAPDVDLKLLSKYVRQRAANGAAPRTINRDLVPLSRMFAFGRREGLVRANPLVGDDYKELRMKEPVPAPNEETLSPEQVTAFIDKAYEVLAEPYATLLDTIAGSGARLDEVIHLDEEDLDEQGGWMRITPKPGWVTKNHRYRHVPVSAQTIAAARKFIKSRSTVSLDRKAIWNQVERVRKLVGLEHFSPHDLRRSWASAMHDRGASMKLISSFLGHCAVSVTERYVKVIRTAGHEFLPR